MHAADRPRRHQSFISIHIHETVIYRVSNGRSVRLQVAVRLFVLSKHVIKIRVEISFFI
jgi:hypothetical protein